jgi:anti-sigma factor RsiW
MTCAEVARVLQHFLDGRLDARRAQRAAAHLDRCRDCGLEAETYFAIKESLYRLGTPPTDAVERLNDFADRLARGDVPIAEGSLDE